MKGDENVCMKNRIPLRAMRFFLEQRLTKLLEALLKFKIDQFNAGLREYETLSTGTSLDVFSLVFALFF